MALDGRACLVIVWSRLMGKLVDLIGRRFTNLVVMRRIGTDKFGRATWVCRCDCGKTTIVPTLHLKTGNTKSCGCLRYVNAQNIKHGLAGSRIYMCWHNMIKRCCDLTDKDYHSYGGRGIRVCRRWRRFENFVVDMGPMPVGLTLDRIDNDKGYHKGNCRWATHRQQMLNTRRNGQSARAREREAA